MTTFSDSGQAEIIRSNQKDEYYISYLRGAVADIAQTFLGARTWIQWHKELNIVSDFTYFVLTTVSGYQTLGEEYVNIIQVDSSKRAVPSVVRRLSMALLYAASPYLIDRLLKKLENAIPHTDFTLQAKEQLLKLIPLIRHAFTFAHRCHLSLFYFRGIYYHISKRLLGVRYILVRANSNEFSQPSFKILGYLFILQLAISVISQLYNFLTRKQSSVSTKSEILPSSRSEGQAVEEQPVTVANKCSLCLEARKDSAVTSCGHLFCWNCIHEWCSTKQECPLCRENCPPSRIVYLQNYNVYS